MECNTRITELLGIRYPIMQGGLHNLASPQLAAAVSNAGGLGTINAVMYKEMDAFKAAVGQVKALTDKPYCVNISMVPGLSPTDMTAQYMDAVAELGVPVVETAGRSPEEYVSLLKRAGIKLIHKVPAVKHAIKAEAVGADAVAIVGFEAGGHPGMDEVTTMILVNKAARSVKIPVLAGGGIADGRGLAAALALGAEGAVVGTRFMATRECLLHTKFKDWIVASSENDTVLVQKSIRNMLRAMKNDTAMQTLEMEARGAELSELMTLISGDRGRAALASGDTNAGLFSAGQVIGLIDSIVSVQQVVNDMVAEAADAADRLMQCFSC